MGGRERERDQGLRRFGSACHRAMQKLLVSNATRAIHATTPAQLTPLRKYELLHLGSGSPRARVSYLENDFRLSDASRNGERFAG